MTLLRPQLLGLGLLAVPIVVFYMVRRRRRRRDVSSLLLWDTVLEGLPRRLRLGVPLAALSLFLVLMALGAGTLALSDPVVGPRGASPRPLVLAIGASARMEGSRFRAAIDRARREVERKASFDPVTILLVSAEPRVLVAGERSKAKVLAALAGARPRLVGADWAVVAPALSREVARGARVVAVGVRPDAPPGAVAVSVGGGSAGIVAFGARPDGESVRLFVRAAGDLSGREIVVSRQGEEIERAPAKSTNDLTVKRGEGGVFRVALDPGEGPRFDDGASAFVPPLRRLRVGVVTAGAPSPFLRAALAALSSIVDRRGSGVVPPDRLDRAAKDFDVLVVDGSAPPRPLPPGRYLLLTPPPASLGFSPLEPVKAAPIWRRAADHPVTRGVDTAEVEAMGATPARLPSGATPLLSVTEGAVAAAGSKGGATYVWIGIGPENSTLPVTAAFPLLVRNSLAWFAALSRDPIPPSVTAGEPFSPRIELPGAVNAVLVQGPGPRGRAVVRVADGDFRWTPPAGVAGPMSVKIGEETFRTWANVVLPGETTAVPSNASAPLGPDRRRLRRTDHHLWPDLAALAAILLLAEWIWGRMSREG